MTLRRLWPIGLGLLGAALFAWYFAPQQTELYLMLPPEARGAPSYDVRVTRAEDGALILRTRRTPAEPAARTLVVPMRLSRGEYLVETWPERPDGAPATRLEARFSFERQQTVEVPLSPP